MNEQTTTGGMRLKKPGEPLERKRRAELTDVPKRKGLLSTLLSGDRLLRDLAVAGGLMLVVLAMRSAGTPQTQSVFATLQEAASMEWDESLGRLSFVSDLLPQGVQAVWSEREAVQVLAPLVGETVHTWTQAEPYVEVLGAVTDVRAVADGTVMSVAHGLNEERIVRIRHDDGLESVYGNLLTCYLSEGDEVRAGDIFARLADGAPLAFELRRDGRSFDPENVWRPQSE